MSNSATAPLGEQIALKQAATKGVDLKALITAMPSAREQRKGGSGKASVAPKGFRFTAPILVRPVLSMQDDAVRQQALADLETFRAQIGPYMQDLAVAIRQIEQLGDDERALAQGDWDTIQSAVAETLNASDPLAKVLATVAYASAMLNTCPAERPWVIATLKNLVEKGFLEDSPKPETDGPFRPKIGEIYAYGRVYSLTPAFAKNDEAQQVLASISNLVSRAVAAGRRYFESRRDEVIALAGDPATQLTLDQLQNPACPNGLRHLPVPEQQWNDREGNRHFRKAGGIVVQVRNERGPAITMVSGYGGVEYDAEKIRAANAFVLPSSLKHERLPLNQRLEPAQYWAVQQLHRLVRLGITEAIKQGERALSVAAFNDACRTEREVLVAKATLTPEQFLLEEKVGSAIIHWAPGAFEWRKFDSATKKRPVVTRIWHLFALMERNERGQIKVAECPQRLAEFFAGHRDYETPGQEYSDLGKLGVILRRAKVNLLKAAEKAAAGEETNGADASETAE